MTVDAPYPVNIHSHLWGGVLFIHFALNLRAFLGHYPTTWVDSVMFLVFLCSAVFCLFASALFHTSTCHSEEVRQRQVFVAVRRLKCLVKVTRRCHAFDYSGIVVLTVGSFYPCLYYGFFCDKKYQVLYILLITMLGLGG
jgi:adiponectin receptor